MAYLNPTTNILYGDFNGSLFRQGGTATYQEVQKKEIKIPSEMELSDYCRTPYTINEVIALRNAIDKIIQSKEKQTIFQTKNLLKHLYKKSTFRMALFTLIQSKPVAAFRALGMGLMTFSIGFYIINLLLQKVIIAPSLLLVAFYFGIFIYLMCWAEKSSQNKKQVK